MALPSFFLWGAWAVRVPYSGARSRDSRTVRGQEMSACFTQLSGVARELIPPQVAPENCSPPGAAGRMALPSFSMRGLGCADALPLAQKCGGEKISCLSHTAIRGRQRTDSTAGGFIDKIFGWVYNNAVCCRGFPALDSKQRSVTP